MKVLFKLLLVFLVFCTLSLLLSFLIIILDSPQWLITILVIQTIIITVIIGLSKVSVWFSYVLFLVFLGGLMVLFSYVVSLSPSFKFFKFYAKTIKAFSALATLFMILLANFIFKAYFTITNEGNFLVEEMTYINSGLWTSSSLLAYLFTTIYLLLALLVIAFLLKYSKGAMRSMT